MIIIGAGLSGLLAGVVNPQAIILEARSEPPATHQAVLRCRSDAISKITALPFERVTVYKALWDSGRERQPTPRLCHQYSQKVIGRVSSRSIFNLNAEERWIPPDYFMQALLEKCSGRIEYGCKIKSIQDLPENKDREPVISTVPMPVLMKILKANPGGLVSPDDFVFCPITVNRFRIDGSDAHATIYYSDPELPIYRATLSNETLIVESTQAITDFTDFDVVFESMGISSNAEHTMVNHTQKYGKIGRVDDRKRRSFITGASIQHGIYSLGRYATWRPNVMLDDVLNDIYVIRRLVAGGLYELLQSH